MARLPGDARDPLGVALEGLAERLARLDVPDADVTVMPSGGEVAFERVPSDAEDPALVADERRLGQLALKVPDACRRISRAGRGVLARGRDGAAEDRRRVTRKGRRAPADRPDLENCLRLAQDRKDVLGREGRERKVAAEVRAQNGERGRRRREDVGLERGRQRQLDRLCRLG
jgi:hypothetical protein